MSIWVTVFCQDSVATATPPAMVAAIRKRLRFMTNLLCPDEEEPPDEVLGRLRIEDARGGGTFERFHIYYRADGRRFLPAERWAGQACAQEVAETLEILEAEAGERKGDLDQVRRVLAGTKESVAFELKASDFRGMGWPVSVSAAAWLAEMSRGLIRDDAGRWMVPEEKDVTFLVR
jgi:hypothetical protein